MGPGPYNCQEAVAFRGCELPIENFTLLCCMGPNECESPGRKNPKQCSFLCLIYVNHGSFHKRNKRYCGRLVLPGHAHRRLSHPIHPLLLTASAKTGGTCPRASFFFFFPPPSDDFPFNCQDALWSNCSHTPSNTQSGNASCTPSHLLQSTLSAAQHTRDGGKE